MPCSSLGDRGASDHDISRNMRSFGRQCHEVGSFVGIWACVHHLFRFCAPSCTSADGNPLFLQTVVMAFGRSICACECVVAALSQLLAASPSSGKWHVVERLAWSVNGKSHVLFEGQSQGFCLKESLWSGGVPAHDHTYLPPEVELGLRGGGEAGWLQPRADIPHVIGKGVRETLCEVCVIGLRGWCR